MAAPTGGSAPATAPADATPAPAAGRAAGAIVVGFAALAVGYAVFVPVFAAPDEPFHFDYVRHLARTGSLPDATDPTRPVSSEAMGPPLYYGLLAGGLRALDPGLGAGLVIHDHADVVRYAADPSGGLPAHVRPPLNPRYVKWGHGDEPTMFLRLPEDRFPWSAATGAVHWLRLFSVACGAVTVWLSYRLAGLVWPDRPELAALAAAWVAFAPQFEFLSGSINNDNLVVALSTAALWFATRRLLAPRDDPARARDEWWLGAFVGLALLAKANAAFLLPVAGGVVLWRARGQDFLREALRGLARVGTPVALIAGWFFVRGAWLYGPTDPLGLAVRASQHPDLVLPPAARATFLLEVFPGRLFRSWWGLFDWISLAMPEPLYWVYGALTGLAAAGLLVRLGGPAPGRELRALVLGLAAFALTLAALLALNRTFHSAQARLLFPAIALVGVLAAAGLDTALGAVLREGARARALRVLPFLLAALAAGVLVGVVAPAYR